MTPEQLKASILQYAIQGKLVEQRPEEGTGEELYQQIQAERQRLIQEKKIKKGKPLAEISEDEIPFDIPESWKWTRLGNIFNLIMGQSPDGKSAVSYTHLDVYKRQESVEATTECSIVGGRFFCDQENRIRFLLSLSQNI